MDADDLVLDGNAVGGWLGEVFTPEVTAAAGRCDGCGTVATVAELVAYLSGPGAVLRCRHCRSIVLRVARAGDRCWLDLRGLTWLQLRVDGLT